ncbi:MAG: 30S ribosomal protein S20, partial [Bdellovibrio sp.]|nr:30S ribosomal protein S20 [Bdellovibrio sp.]
MANTRSSLKRARQNVKRNTRNKIIRSNTKSTVRNIVDLVKTKAQDALDPQKIYSAYLL